jgi:hypothetical protein
LRENVGIQGLFIRHCPDDPELAWIFAPFPPSRKTEARLGRRPQTNLSSALRNLSSALRNSAAKLLVLVMPSGPRGLVIVVGLARRRLRHGREVHCWELAKLYRQGGARRIFFP